MIKYFDILKQYVNTGKAIPEYQLEKVFKMGRGLPKSYFRARVNFINNFYEYLLEEYEIPFLNRLAPNIKDDILSNIENAGVKLQLMDVDDRDEAIERIIKDDDFMSQLDSNNVEILLKFSSNPEQLAEKIVKIKNKDLLWFQVASLFDNIKNHARLIKIIFKEMGDFLDEHIMYIILLASNTPKVLESIIGQRLYNEIEELNDDQLKYLLKESPNPNELISIFLNSGITKEKINKLIKDYNINLPLLNTP